MKKVSIILALALGCSLALANPIWTSETIVREGQDLRFGGTAVQVADGSVITVWTQTREGENLLLASKLSGEGISLWNEPLLVKSGEAVKRALQIVETGDGEFILAWLEDLDAGNSQLQLQKINDYGIMLWSAQGVAVNSDCQRDRAKYYLSGNAEGGALLFAQPDTDQPMALGYRFDASGNDLWISNRPTLQANGTLKLQGLIAKWYDSEIVVAWQETTPTGVLNRFKHFNAYGSGTWEQAYPKYPGEYGDHQFCLTSDERIWDMALTALMDTRIKLKLLTWGGNWNIEEPLELVVNPSPVPLKTSFIGYAFTWPRVLCSTIVNGVSELRIYHFYNNGTQVADQLIRSSSEVLIGSIDYVQDNTGQQFFVWEEKSAPDWTRTLKAQTFNNDTLELAWTPAGLTLSAALDDVSRPRCFAWNTSLLSLAAEPGLDAKYLRRRVFSAAGTPQLTPEQEILASALSGEAWPVRSLDVDDSNFLFYADSRQAGATRLYLQKLSLNGELLLPGDGIRLGSGDSSVLLDAVNHTYQHFAALYYSDGLHLQILDLSGNTQWPGPGLLISPQLPVSARLASYEGDVYISWEIDLDSNRKRVMGQRVSNGQAIWGADGVIVKNEVYSQQTAVGPPVARHFTWSERWPGSSNYQVRGKRLDAFGNAETGWYADGNMLFYREGFTPLYPSQATLSGSDLILLIDGGTVKPAYAQKVSPDIQLPWGMDGVELLGDSGTYLAGMADQHGVVIGFKHNDGVYVQAVNPPGELISASPGNRLDQTPPAQVGKMALGRFASGHFMAVWSAIHPGTTSDLELHFSRASSWGETLDYIPRLLCSAPGDQDLPVLSNPGLETMFVSWRDGRSGYGDHGQMLNGVRAQMISWSDTAIPSEQEIPAAVGLKPCYPNPFREFTNICWDQKDASPVLISVYNLKGQLVKRFEPQRFESGELVWAGEDSQGRQVSPGLYFIRLQSGPKVQTGKVLRW
jgi:hypothetical protein